jgi:hypothetical protein
LQTFHPYFVGLHPSTVHIAAALKNFLISNEWHKIAVITDETVNSQMLVRNLKHFIIDDRGSIAEPEIEVYPLAFYSETKPSKIYVDLSGIEVFGGKVVFVYCSSETLEKLQIEAEKLRFFSRGWVWIFYEFKLPLDYQKLPIGSIVMKSNPLSAGAAEMKLLVKFSTQLFLRSLKISLNDSRTLDESGASIMSISSRSAFSCFPPETDANSGIFNAVMIK